MSVMGEVEERAAKLQADLEAATSQVTQPTPLPRCLAVLFRPAFVVGRPEHGLAWSFPVVIVGSLCSVVILLGD